MKVVSVASHYSEQPEESIASNHTLELNDLAANFREMGYS